MVKSYMQWLLLLALSASAFGDDSSLVGAREVNTVESVRRQLVGMEWRSDQQDWQAERAVEGPLAAIARAQSEPHFIRGRALEALTHLPGPLAREVFQELIAQDQSPVLRRRAVDCLCALPAETSNEDSLLHSLLPLLESPDRHLGVRVARCLAAMDSPATEITMSIQRYLATAEEWEIQSAGLQRESK